MGEKEGRPGRARKYKDKTKQLEKKKNMIDDLEAQAQNGGNRLKNPYVF